MRTPITIALAFIYLPFACSAATISVTPGHPLQGEAVLVRIDLPLSQISAIDKDGKALPYFGTTTTEALIGVGNGAALGTSTIVVTAKSGATFSASYVVMPRVHPTEPLAVPAQLGGNSAANQAHFVSILSKENALLAALVSDKKTLWTQPFIGPLPTLLVTDPYGYNRDSTGTTIVHKGADFKAPVGTSVYAMNSGVVVMSRYSPVYGGTIVIDHGEGVMTMYMHLSKRLVEKGATVLRNQKIALSGNTGYAEGAHLHITVRINGESIDPVEFLGLFGVAIPSS